MRICYLTHNMNPRTGAGVFSNKLIDGVRAQNPMIEVSVMTSENLLPPSRFKILLNLRAIRRAIIPCDIIHALDAYPYGVIAAVANVGIGKPFVMTAVGTGAVQKLGSPLLRWAYRKASRVTAISSYVAGEIKKVLPDLEIKIINHGV